MTWDGKERRLADSQFSEMLRGHILQDEEALKKLNDKIHSIDVQLSSLIVLNTETLKNQMTMMTEVKRDISEHQKFLFGNGDNHNGVNSRIQTLEDIEESRKWSFRLIWSTIGAMVAKIFYDILRR